MSDGDPHVELALPADAESVVIARQMVRGLDRLPRLGRREPHRHLDRRNRGVHQRGPPRLPRGRRRVRACAHGSVRSGSSWRCATEGRGITPRVESPAAGLGLGLPLMLAIGDEVSFASDGEGVTEVRMAFSPASRRA